MSAARDRRVRVALRKDLARAIRRGAPWVWRDALAAPTAPVADGAEVVVTTRDRRDLGAGFWDARSAIAVRLLAPPGESDLRGLADRRVDEALTRRLAFIDRARTDAFRWIHGEADGLPGVHVDLYGEVAAVRFDGAGARAFYRDLPGWLVRAGAALPVRAVVDRETRAALFGTAPAAEIEVRENGLRFGVDLAHGQKGGLFLDQRDNRAAVAALARGRTVLNLFGYTGGFSVYAAAAGATATTTVDLARPALEAARRNFARNGLPLDHARFEAADGFAFLERAAAAGEQWDVVICDPPSFAPSRKALPAARRAYARLHRLAAAVVAPGGLLAAASCSSHMPRDEFLRSVGDGVAAAGRGFDLVEQRGAGPDHPVIAAFPEGDYLKFVIGRVR